MKKKNVVWLLLVVCFMLLLSACQGGGGGSSDALPKGALSIYLDSAKTYDLETMKKYVGEGGLFGEQKAVPAEDEEVVKAILAKMTYTVENAVTDGDVGVVNIKVTTPDAKTIKAGGAEGLAEKVAAADAPTVTTDVEVVLNQEGNSWLIVVDDAFYNALTGGLYA